MLDEKAWAEYCRRTENAARLVIAASPDDPFDRAEGLRYVGRIAQHGLQSFIEESDPTCPVVTHSLPKLGGDNPDYVYSVAALSGAYEYRLRGRLGDSSYLGIGTYHGGVGTAEGLQLSGYLAGKDLVIGADGGFEIVLACEKRPGNWLPMRTETSQLMIRELLLDRRHQRSAQFTIERTTGGPVSRPLDPDHYATQLARAGAYVEGAIAQFLEWTKDFASRPNRIDRLDERLASGAPRRSAHPLLRRLLRDRARRGVDRRADAAGLRVLEPPALQPLARVPRLPPSWRQRQSCERGPGRERDGPNRDRGDRSRRPQLARHRGPPPRLHHPAPGRHADARRPALSGRAARERREDLNFRRASRTRSHRRPYVLDGIIPIASHVAAKERSDVA
jgi:hypothetical protein